MTRYRFEVLTSADALRATADAWDELWARSDSPAPTSRAETAAQWVDTFAPQARVLGPMVFDRDRPVAAMLLVGRRGPGLLESGSLAINDWSDCGDFLLDPSADREQAADVLWEAIVMHGRWPLVRFDAIAIDERRWQLLAAAAKRREMPVDMRPDCQIGRVVLPADWSSYEAGWSANHRRHMRRCQRRAEAGGQIEIRAYENPTGELLRELLNRGLEIEDRSWKGAAGTSLLKQPRAAEFLMRQAEQLARWGQLVLVFLEQNGRPIAFELGHVAKATYFSAKVGYDSQFSEYSPGQLLRLLWLERMCAEASVRTLDFWGPLTPATAKWSNDFYRGGRMLIAMPGPLGRSAFALYKLARQGRGVLRAALGRMKPASAVLPRAKRFSAEAAGGEGEEALAGRGQRS